MPEEQPPIARHEAADRFGKAALRTAHDLTAALAEETGTDVDPVVLRTDGPHRTVDGLAALIDEALADESSRPDPRAGDESGC